MAKQLAKTSREDQKTKTRRVWDFLTEQDKDLNALNNDQLAVAFLMVVLEKMDIRVLHSIGYGTKNFMTVSPVAGKVLGMFEDGDEDMAPDIVVLQNTILNIRDTLILPPRNRILESVESGIPIPAKDVELRGQTLLATPVPAFVVYDGMTTGDLDPWTIYKRLDLGVDGVSEWKSGAMKLLAMVMMKLRANDMKPGT